MIRTRKRVIIAVIIYMSMFVTVLLFCRIHNGGKPVQEKTDSQYTIETSAVRKLKKRIYAVHCERYEEGKLSQLYEAFLKYYAECSWVYAYHDSDGDGQEEMYILKTNYSEPRGYIVRYQNNGLQICYQEEFLEEIYNVLEWNPMPETTEAPGVEVYVEQDPGDGNNYWYAEEESFLTGFGFQEMEPFYEYLDEEGGVRLVLYFNEQTGEGCGIRYIGDKGEFPYGFAFADVAQREWSGFLTEYDKQISIEGNTGETWVKDYQEEFEYDAEGRLIKYVSSGIYEEDVEPGCVLEMEYKYHENGNLKYRFYHHNPMVFATSFTVWESYFDELGRVEYEWSYITHGSMEYFYIYSDDNETPSQVLTLDNYLGDLIPVFTCY